MEAVTERIFACENLILDGNVFKQKSHVKLATLISNANPLLSLSIARCQLEDHGLELIFEAAEGLRRLKKVDFSSNNIMEKGIREIANMIGNNRKTELEVIKLNNNHVTDSAVKKILKAIEKYENHI